MIYEEDRTLRPTESLLNAPDRGKHPGLRPNRRNEGIVDPHVGPEIDQLLDDLDGGRLPGIVDVLLVGKAHDRDFRPIEALANLPETSIGEVDDVHFHELVDLAGGLGETGRAHGWQHEGTDNRQGSLHVQRHSRCTTRDRNTRVLHLRMLFHLGKTLGIVLNEPDHKRGHIDLILKKLFPLLFPVSLNIGGIA